MNRVIFVLSVILLLVLSLWRYISGFFIDSDSLAESFTSHLPYLILGALGLGVFYILFFVKVFPNGWHKQSSAGQVGIIVVFLCLAFAVMRQSSITLNLLLPGKQKRHFSALIFNKSIETTSKGAKFYSLVVKEIGDSVLLNFSVSKKYFNKYIIGDTLNKEIITGYFNIKYGAE